MGGCLFLVGVCLFHVDIYNIYILGLSGSSGALFVLSGGLSVFSGGL